MQVGSFQVGKTSGLVGGKAGLSSELFPGSTEVLSRRAKHRPRPGFAVRLDPLYLFHCGLLWHEQADNSAGWELIRGLRLGDRVTRAVSATLLSKTENARLLVRDLRRARNGLRATGKVNGTGRLQFDQAVEMNTPYGLEIIDSCMNCKLRKHKWFCGLSPDALRAFSAVTRPSIYPGGALLFVEGQMPRGAYVLCSGKVKLSTTSRDGKILIFKLAEAGEVLGLSAAISGTSYELTAETAGPCHVNFVRS